MAEVCGKFKLVSSENFDEFMKAMGKSIEFYVKFSMENSDHTCLVGSVLLFKWFP